MKAIAHWFHERASPRSSQHRKRPEKKQGFSLEDVPAKRDRALLLRAVMVAADVIYGQRRDNHASQDKRLNHLLQEQVVPAAAKSLLLIKDDDNEDALLLVLANAATLPNDEDMLEDAVACITLLLSNMILKYTNGYDARVRHVLKTACVHVLQRELTLPDDFDESVGAIFDGRDPPTMQQEAASSNDDTPDDLEGATDAKKSESSDDDEEETADSIRIEGAETAQSTQEQQVATNALVLTANGSSADSQLDPIQSRIMFLATRKFEAIEREIATEIFRALLTQQEDWRLEKEEQEKSDAALTPEERRTIVKRRVIRGLQVSSVGVVAGALFAVTGGLAAPALAAGIASIGAVTSSTAVATVAVLTTVKAAAAVFGVSGGGLAAYKMKKRTRGLKEFRIRRENIEQNIYEGASDESLRRGVKASLPQLHTTICVSGWLREKYKGADFQAAWGVQPTDPQIESKLELLKRFYAVYGFDKVATCEADMKERRKRERKDFSWDVVWKELEKMYGSSPDHLLPLNSRAVTKPTSLSCTEEAKINDVLDKVVLKKQQDSSHCASTPPVSPRTPTTTTSHKVAKDASPPHSKKAVTEDAQQVDLLVSNETTAATAGEADGGEQAAGDENEVSPPQQQQTEAEERLVVWDWETIYGSDLHTITWETDVLANMCHIASSMALEVTTQATKLALQYSMFVGAVVAAAAVPSALLTATNVIDDPYQIVILRADEAGKELAKCLLQSEEKRPVTLVGYSFGARVIHSCLMELARYQDLWDKEQHLHNGPSGVGGSGTLGKSQSDSVTMEQMTREPASIVEDVVVMGLPRAIDVKNLKRIRHVVAGRFVNCYTKNDWVLTLMFLCRGSTEACGTHPIRGVPGVENYNVTDLVEAHSKFAEVVPRILQRVGLGKPLSLP